VFEARMRVVFAFALLTIAFVATEAKFNRYKQIMAGCNGSPDFGKPNTNPIINGQPVLVKSVPNGKLFTMQVGSHPNDTIAVTHLWGTPYQKGFAHGQLIAERGKKLVAAVYKWIDDQVSAAINGSVGPIPYDIAVWLANTGLNAGLDIMSALTGRFTGAHFPEQIRGLAEGAGMDANSIRRIHMLGEITKGRCSMFGAWGNHLKDKNGLLTLRALDWVMDGPFKDYPEITIYHAQNERENTFLNLGWSGWLASITGVNDKKLSIHEIGVAYPDDTYGPETFAGIPFGYLLRDILQFDKTRAEANKRYQTANRTCHLILGVGDGKEKRMNAVQYGWKVANIVEDHNLIPVATWHPKIENVVYYGMDWICPGYDTVMAAQLNKFKGNFTAEDAIRDVMAVVQTGDLHVYVADLPNDLFYFSIAASRGVPGPMRAYERAYTKIDLKSFWNVGPPTAEEILATQHVAPL